MATEFERSEREGKAPDELTNKVWALDQRQLLNTRRWLGQPDAPAAEPLPEMTHEAETVPLAPEPSQDPAQKIEQAPLPEPTLFEFL